MIDASYISKFFPRCVNKFAFSPSKGASGGLLTAWNGNLFDGEVICINWFSATVKFSSLISDIQFYLTNIYGPSTAVEKANFVNWLYTFDVSSFDVWALVGYFNFIRGPEHRNKPGGSMSDMILFNDYSSS